MPENNRDKKQGTARGISSGTSVAASLVARYIRFVWWTNTVVYEPEDLKASLEQRHPLILAVWHGQFLLVPLLRPEGIDARVLVARHGDAAMIGQVMEKLGSGVISGAGAGYKKVDKGGKAALMAALKALKNDTSVVLTADVPPGPARRAGMGIVMMAKLSGKPIVPVAIATRRYGSAKSWSRFTLNFPFTRQAVVMGKAIVVPKTARGETLEEYRAALEAEMVQITGRAYELAGANALKATPPASRPLAKPGLGLKAYAALMTVARPLAPLILSRRLKKGKEDAARLPERYGRATVERPEGFLVWFHCASVGETNAVLPMVGDLLAQNPGVGVLLTTMTSSSAGQAKKLLPNGAVHQFVPLDVPLYVKRFLDHWQPDMGIFVESEIWPNLLLGASGRNFPLFLVNGIMSKRSFRKWRRKEHMAQQIFSRFNHVFAQNEALALWYHRLGAKDVSAVGNLKLDSPPPPIDREKLAQLEQGIDGRTVFLAASTHDGEDSIVADAHALLKQDFPDLLTIIVPRHPERAGDIAVMLEEKGLASVRRSWGGGIKPETSVYIADTIGEMGVFYSVAKVAFVGGSLVPKGGQNPVEAIKLETAVLTGLHHVNQNQYIPLLAAGAVLEVGDARQMAGSASFLLGDRVARQGMIQKASGQVEQMCGAKGKVLAALQAFLPMSRPR